MQKIFMIVFLSVIIFILANCNKKTEAITEPAEEDTTGGHVVVRKPNIYIYPQQEVNIKINLKFPNGGSIVESIPEYGNGWNVKVKPNGFINDQYDYLFYEADIPDLLQIEYGWKVNGAKLDSFFSSNLQSLNFSLKEIKDFTDYWIPLLDENKEYAIYPQYNNNLLELIQIETSITPGNIIRVWYLIEEYNDIMVFGVPVVPSFERTGFVILEWGVVY
jgi:hypothetical protein